MAARVIELQTPADDQASIVIRMTTAGTLSHAGLSLDGIEDAKLAAEEACKCLVRSSGCARLNILYETDEEQFLLYASSLTPCSYCEGISDEEVGVIRCVLLSLMDTVELEFDDRCLRGIRMAKRLNRDK